MTRLWILVSCLAALTGGCDEARQTVQAGPAIERGFGTSQQAELAIGDLAARLGVAPADIEVAKETAVTWRDGSFGCPKEGMMYTQALAEGTLIVLRANGQNYAYHSGKGRPPFLCENPQKPAASSPDRE